MSTVFDESALCDSVKEDVAIKAGGSVVLLKVGAVGGSVTLVGRKDAGAQWRFARVTVEEALFGEAEGPLPEAPAIASLEWVDRWEAGLALMDRYPWTRLHPLTVHPAFVDRVRVAVDERLAGVPQGSDTERVRGKWERLLEQSGSQSREGDL